jgi:hypothetical protein
VLEKSGTHYTFAGKSIGQGRDKARDHLLVEPELLSAVRAATLEALPSQAPRVGKPKAA